MAQKEKIILSFIKILYQKDINREYLFNDITKIELGNYTNDSIRLFPKIREKLKNGVKKAYKLINRPDIKFVKFLMVSEKITYGTLNEFTYGQDLFSIEMIKMLIIQNIISNI